MPHVPATEQSSQPETVSQRDDDGRAPVLGASDTTANEGDGSVLFAVSLRVASAAPVTVSYATQDGSATAVADYVAVQGTLTFAANTTGVQRVEVPVNDDQVAEGTEHFELLLSEPGGTREIDSLATAEILDNDHRSITVEPSALLVREGDTGSYRVALGTQPTATVTVAVEVPAGVDLVAVPATLSFAPEDWDEARMVTVTTHRDTDAAADAPVLVRHEATGGGYDGVSTPTTVTIVEVDSATLAVPPVRALEGSGSMRFAVTLSLQRDHEVSVYYETGAAGDTATEGEDYASTSGTLTFPPRSQARMIEVGVIDDAVDEPDEQFTLTLRNAHNATLAGGGTTATAAGTIEDDDLQPALSIGDGVEVYANPADIMRFTVSLDPASESTVTAEYATADVTPNAGEHYTAASGAITFLAGTTTQTIEVPIHVDGTPGGDHRFSVTLYHPSGARLEDATATGTITTITGAHALELTSLLVSGAGSEPYPAFASDIHHYAVRCASSVTLDVTAEASHPSTRLTLLRNNAADNQSSTGILTAQVVASSEHDIAVELSGGGDTVTYVVHCIPPDFPTIKVLHKTAEVAGGADVADAQELHCGGGLQWRSEVCPPFCERHQELPARAEWTLDRWQPDSVLGQRSEYNRDYSTLRQGLQLASNGRRGFPSHRCRLA